MQTLFHLQQFLGLGFHHLVHRDAGPLRNDFSDVVLVHNLIQLVLDFPGVTFYSKFLLKSEALCLFLRGSFVIALLPRLFFFGHHTVHLGLKFFQLGGEGVQRDANLSSRFIHQVDCFVR